MLFRFSTTLHLENGWSQKKNWVTFGPWRWESGVDMILMKLNVSGNSGVSRCISDVQQPRNSKRAGLRAKYNLNLYVFQFYVVIVRHLVKQRVKTSGLFVFRFPEHETLCEWTFQNDTPPTNRSRRLSNLSWFFLHWSSQKYVWDFWYFEFPIFNDVFS